MFCPDLIYHLVFRVADLKRTERFYAVLFGPAQYKDDESVMFCVGETRLFFTPATQARDGAYDKEAIGLNHLAFRARSGLELGQIAGRLRDSGIPHSGIQVDPYGLKEFIWMDDLDGIRVEFYLRADS